MRPSPHVRATLRALLAPSARLLLVGVRGFGHAGAREVASLAELAHVDEPADALVWLVRSAPLAPLGALRRCLCPGGQLIVWVEPNGVATRVWSALARTKVRTAISLEDACESLVLAGLLMPRVLASGSRGFAVSGTTPARLDPLDAVFTQPAP